MIFWGAHEAYRLAADAARRTRKSVEAYLNASFADTSLATFECKLRYIPIVMPVGMRENYPARSKLRKKERIWDCAPQLNYDVFVDGSFEEQLKEYIGGFADSGPQLAKLGATPEQVSDFDRIIATAAERILAELPGGNPALTATGASGEA